MPASIPIINGIDRVNPERAPAAASIRLFGPGVADIAKENAASAPIVVRLIPSTLRLESKRLFDHAAGSAACPRLNQMIASSPRTCSSSAPEVRRHTPCTLWARCIGTYACLRNWDLARACAI